MESDYYISFASGIAISGKYAYLTCREGLAIVDISDCQDPYLTATYPIEKAMSVKISGDYAYVAAGNDGLLIIDISNPKDPILIGSYPAKGWFAENSRSKAVIELREIINGLNNDLD